MESQIVTLAALPEPEPEPDKPPRCIRVKAGNDIRAFALAKLEEPRLCLLPEVGFAGEQTRFPFKQFYRETPWRSMERVSHAQINEWLFSWREYFEKFLHQAIAPQNVAFFAGRISNKELPEEPSAFAVFNEVGIPVLLIPTEWAEAVHTPLSRSSVAQIRAASSRLGVVGIEDISLLAVAWPQLVGDAIEADRGLAAALMQDARREIERLASKGAFAVVDQQLEAEFKRRGFTNDVSLANMKYEEAVEIAGECALVWNLLEVARNRVPESAWKLDSLGFNDTQMEKLASLGVETQGDWVKLTEDAAGRRQATAELGVDSAFIDATRQTAAANQTLAVAETVAVPSLENVSGVNDAIAGALAGAGVLSVDDLAGSKADELATKIGISEPQAALIINDARTKVTGSQGIETLKFAGDVQGQLKNLNINTVADLLDAPIDTITAAFGDPAKAKGVQDGLARLFGRRR